MPILDRAGVPLFWDQFDTCPPWEPERPVILFCHGVATNAHMWDEWLPVLLPHYRIVRFDLRGFGRSGTTPGPDGWTLDLLADDLLAVADAAGVDRFHLVGESTGGTLALYMATQRNPRLRSIVASNAAHKGGSIGAVREWRAMIGDHGMTAWSEDIMAKRFPACVLSKAQWDWYHGVQAATDADALLGVADMLIAADLSDALPRVAVPTLLLTPGRSPFVSSALMRDIASGIPDVELRLFPDAQHGLPFSHATACAEAVSAFLKARQLDRI